MENKVCCFFGHREVYEDIRVRLDIVIEDLIVHMGARTFMTGGMGSFDEMAEAAVRLKKKTYPETELVLVRPYLTQELNRNRERYTQKYDSILIPPSLAGMHYKSVISARNRWLVDHSDFVIAYVHRPFGGAYEAVRYAEKQGLPIVRVGEA